MSSSIFISFAVLLSAVTLALGASDSQQDATMFALIYGYPLIPYLSFIQPLLSTDVGVNNFLPQRTLAEPNAASQVVVRPNADTLYSSVAVDLSRYDLELRVPRVTDGRFWVFPFYDLYGNNFANIGIVANDTDGIYLIRKCPHFSGCPGKEIVRNETSKYQGYINFPTTYGAILNRYLLRNHRTDLQAVYALQNQSSLLEINRTGAGNYEALPLSLSLFGNSSSSPTAEEQLDNLARLTPYSPPEVVANQTTVIEILACAGLRKGKYTKPSGVNLTAAATTANQTIISSLHGDIFLPVNDGWTEELRANQGDFHSDYIERAVIAYTGYLQLVPDQALYPSYSGSAKILLERNDAYVYTFSSKPPVNGFWSLTVYGNDQYLIPNPLNRPNLGDRSNLTYPDGQLVYGGDEADQGTFQILIQAADVAPPSNWTNNWLPGPAGGGNFTVNLRFYAPQAPLLNNTYQLPIVSKQPAIIE